MKKTITSISLIALLSCNTFNSERQMSPEELKMELKKQEQFNPAPYLIASAQMSPNKVKTSEEGFFHKAEYVIDGYNIVGTIKNTASLARFKDAVVNVTFLSQTQTAIETKQYVLYEFFEPNSTKPFSLKVHPPQATKGFNLDITNASPTN